MIPTRAERKKFIPYYEFSEGPVPRSKADREARMWGSLSLQRLDEQKAIQDDLTYGYYDFSNKLKNVDETGTENYTYDEIEGRALKNANFESF